MKHRLLKFLFQTRLGDEQREMQLRRILFIETNIMLPIKVVAIIGAVYFYRVILGITPGPTAVDDAPHVYFTQLKFFGAGNLIFWMLLLAARVGELWPRSIRFAAFWLVLLDNLFISGLIYFTDGLQSAFYWLYIGLMIRAAMIFPVFWQQMVLNFSNCVFYTLAVFLDEETFQFFKGEIYWLRISVLLLVGACCWGVYLLMDRERRRAAAQTEFQLRSEKIFAQGLLAAEVAHQLKNPLGIIMNASYLLQRLTEKDSEIGKSVTVIREEVVRSDKILTQLMNFSRLSEGRIENVNINAALEQALLQARPDGWAARIAVVRDLADGLPMLAAQRAQLEEAFLNLIQNAIEAMPEGGTLKVRSQYAGNGQIAIDVEDSGKGIDNDAAPRVFDAFFTTKSGGTGLGLAIVKNTVATYGGTISVNSKRGQGTCFRMLLPVQTKPKGD